MGGEAGPAADAARVLELLHGSPEGVTLRIDANQAWTMDEALCFSAALAGNGGWDGCGGRPEGVVERNGGVRAVEYIEEPLRDPRLLGEFWERSGKMVPYALDESLSMDQEVFTEDVSVCLRRVDWGGVSELSLYVRARSTNNVLSIAQVCRRLHGGEYPFYCSNIDGTLHRTTMPTCFVFCLGNRNICSCNRTRNIGVRSWVRKYDSNGPPSLQYVDE